MAMQKLLFSDDYLSDADIKRLLMDETAFGGANNVHEGGLMSNRPVADKPTIEFLTYQNGCIPQQHHPMPILGQLGLSQRVSDYQKTICSSNRVSSCRVTGIHPMQSQPMNCHGDFQVTEVVRDHVIAMVSTREHISVSNHQIVFSNQSIYKNMNPAVVNQVPQAVTESELLHHQTPTKGLRHGGVAASPFHVPFPETNGQGILPNGQLNSNSRGLRLPTPGDQAVPNHQPKINEGQEQQNIMGERSHLHKNHGPPYACVKCGEVLITTQCYAAHTMSHYQAEKVAERLKRQATKYKENLHHMQSSNGLASGPGQSLKMTGIGHGVSFKGNRGKKPKMVFKTEAASVKKEPTDVQMAVKQEFLYRGVVIKEEPN